MSDMNEFRERIISRVREDIGDMLEEEALDSLVKEAVARHFFEPRVQKGNFGSNVMGPSWFETEVADRAKPFLKEAVDRYVEANKADLQKALDTFLSGQNLTLLAVAAMGKEISKDTMEAVKEIQQFIRQGY